MTLWKSVSGKRAREVKEWMRSKELARSPVASEPLVLAGVLDRMMMHDDLDGVTDTPAGELTCLRIYAIWKAYEQVHALADWQRPKSQSKSRWRSAMNKSYNVPLMAAWASYRSDRSAENKVT